MGKKRHTPEEIISKLRQVEVLVAQGTPVADAIRAIGVTEVDRDRELATALQFGPAARLPGLPTTGSGGVRARLRRLVGGAIPTGAADQALGSATTDHELTFNPDHPMGADHLSRQEPTSRRSGDTMACSSAGSVRTGDLQRCALSPSH